MRRSLTLEGAGLVVVASGIASSEKDAGKGLRLFRFHARIRHRSFEYSGGKNSIQAEGRGGARIIVRES